MWVNLGTYVGRFSKKIGSILQENWVKLARDWDLAREWVDLAKDVGQMIK